MVSYAVDYSNILFPGSIFIKLDKKVSQRIRNNISFEFRVIFTIFRVLETSLKNKNDEMMAETRRNFFGLSKTFSGSFLRAGYPARVQIKFKGKQKTQFLSQSLV